VGPFMIPFAVVNMLCAALLPQYVLWGAARRS
jgi:hypothetical protein